MQDDQLSVNKKLFWWAVAVIILLSSAFFAAGYLYRGQNERAPIIIEKCS